VSSSHAKAGWASKMLASIARFLRELNQNAEQLTADQRWRHTAGGLFLYGANG